MQSMMKIDAHFNRVITLCALLQFPGEAPNELQYIQLMVINQKDCLSASIRVTNNNICTLNKQGEGACHVSAFSVN